MSRIEKMACGEDEEGDGLGRRRIRDDEVEDELDWPILVNWTCRLV